MKYRALGHTGLYVSEVTLGTMTFVPEGSEYSKIVGGTGQELADKMVRLAMESGVNLFDTANSYGYGDSEITLGKALKASGAKREDYLIATKAYNTQSESINALGTSRLSLLREIDKSLERLDTDYIDLYQLHSFDKTTPLKETIKSLNALVTSGKVRYIGLSNFAAWEIAQAQGIAGHLGLEEFCSVQAYYSLAGRELEREIMPAARELGLGVLVWSPLAGGFLSGKYSGSNAQKGGRRKSFSIPPVDRIRGDEIVLELEKIAKNHDASVAQIALAWLLHQEEVTSIIVGARKEEQLIDNLRATEIELTSAEMNALDDVSALALEYPHYLPRADRGQNPRSKLLGKD